MLAQWWVRAPTRAAASPAVALGAVALIIGLLACAQGASPEPSSSELGGSDASAAGSSGAAGSPGAVPPVAPAPGSGAADPATPVSPVDAGPALVVSSCSGLSRRACMASTSCTLLLAGGSLPSGDYVCRAAEPPCEVGLAQSELSGSGSARAECESRPGCGVDPGNCYCACRGSGQTAVPDDDETPPCNCACGGGAPPRCALVTE
jgi:hypothetical protein